MSSGRGRRECATTTQDTPTTSGEKGSTRSRNTIRDCTTWDATSLGSWTELSVLIPTHFQAFYKQSTITFFFFTRSHALLAFPPSPPAVTTRSPRKTARNSRCISGKAVYKFDFPSTLIHELDVEGVRALRTFKVYSVLDLLTDLRSYPLVIDTLCRPKFKLLGHDNKQPLNPQLFFFFLLSLSPSRFRGCGS